MDAAAATAEERHRRDTAAIEEVRLVFRASWLSAPKLQDRLAACEAQGPLLKQCSERLDEKLDRFVFSSCFRLSSQYGQRRVRGEQCPLPTASGHHSGAAAQGEGALQL